MERWRERRMVDERKKIVEEVDVEELLDSKDDIVR